MKSLRAAVVAATLVFIAVEAGAGESPRERQVSLVIESRTLAEALDQWAQQTGFQIFVPNWDLAKKISAPRLQGKYGARDALNRLLEGTPLMGVWTTDRAVTIREKVAPIVWQSDPSQGPAVQKFTPDGLPGRDAPATSSSRPSDEPIARSTRSTSASDIARVSELEGVVVTGSYISGSPAAGSKVIVIDRETIDRGGYTRIQDVLATITQTSKAISDEAVGRGFGSGAGGGNVGRGAEVQLRGLGNGTTLLLVNGRRQAVGGEQGSMTDISSIATSAVERIEILPEGASALYGSDAIGGVVNIILRKDFEGLETRVSTGMVGGEANENLFAQLWGGAWSAGRALVGYQYNERDALAAADRPYSAANNDYRRFGGTDHRTFGSNPGTILDPDSGDPVGAIPRGQDGTNLTADELLPGVNFTDSVTYNVVMPEQQMHSAFLNASYYLTDQWEAFVDGHYSTRDFELTRSQDALTLTVPEHNAFNAMGAPVTVAYDLTRDIGPERTRGNVETAFAATGVTGSLPGRWHLTLSGSYAKERSISRTSNMQDVAAAFELLESSDPSTALNVFGDGSHTNATTIAALREEEFSRTTRWTTASANVLADGPLFTGPAGTVKFAVGADHRREHITNFNSEELAEGIVHDDSQDVSAIFAELAVPILGPRTQDVSENRLELSVAGRYEEYEYWGNTFNPKIGLSWRPWNDLTVRGTWGTSFRAPQFYQVSNRFQGSQGSAFNAFVFPMSAPSGDVSALILTGADPATKEETADVWTAGFDFSPSVLEALSLSFTFFDIDYKDKIQTAGDLFSFLFDEAQFAPVITHDPTQAQIDAICNSPGFLFGDCNEPISVILDARVRNLAGLQTRGLDADVNYALATSLGQWHFGLRGTYTFDYKTQLTATARVFDNVDTYGNPLALRLVGLISWELGPWTAQGLVNYAGGYKTSHSSSVAIDSWTTVDLNVGYRTDPGQQWFGNVRLNLAVINAFDEDPPFVDSAVLPLDSVYGYDGANANLLGRQVRFQVIKAW